MASILQETGKAFSQEKVDGAASGEKHLDSSLDKQQVPAGARELKEVRNAGLHERHCMHYCAMRH